jgi:hypothetical protein
MSRKKFKQINQKGRNRAAAKNSSATSGQALIEFVLGLMIVISFFFFYVKMAAVFAVGNYIHYATFMAARALSSSADTPDQQIQNAEAVLNRMVVGRWKPLLKPKDGNSTITGANVGPGPSYQEDPAQDSWNEGVTYTYETKISLYPWSKGNQAITMNLTSESWMKREDSEAEVGTKRSKIQAAAKLPYVYVEWDNGL